MIHYDDYKSINLRCFFCEEEGHFATGCPRIHYGLKKENIIKKYLETQSYFRKNYKRSNFRYITQGNKLQKLAEAAALISKKYATNSENPTHENGADSHENSFDLKNNDEKHSPELKVPTFNKSDVHVKIINPREMHEPNHSNPNSRRASIDRHLKMGRQE